MPRRHAATTHRCMYCGSPAVAYVRASGTEYVLAIRYARSYPAAAGGEIGLTLLTLLMLCWSAVPPQDGTMSICYEFPCD